VDKYVVETAGEGENSHSEGWKEKAIAPDKRNSRVPGVNSERGEANTYLLSFAFTEMETQLGKAGKKKNFYRKNLQGSRFSKKKYKKNISKNNECRDKGGWEREDLPADSSPETGRQRKNKAKEKGRIRTIKPELRRASCRSPDR